MTNILETISFGATSTADDVLSGVNLKGKRILVTGVSAGLGVETARSLAAHGAQVVGTARDLTKAKAATGEVRQNAAANGGTFELVELDLAKLKSVRACADGLLAKGEAFDVVIANAGVMATPFGHSADGFETRFGTNHLGHFVLVNRIAPLIRNGGRLINLSSSGHRYSNVDLDDPNFEHTPYEPFGAYGPIQNGEYPVRGCIRQTSPGSGRSRCGCASGRQTDGVRSLRGIRQARKSSRRDQSAARRPGQGALPMEVHSPGSRDFGVGGCGCPG